MNIPNEIQGIVMQPIWFLNSGKQSADWEFSLFRKKIDNKYLKKKYYTLPKMRLGKLTAD